jgi:aminoglycoside 2''-phosphotransferase
MASGMNLQWLTIELREAFPTSSIHSPLELVGEGFGSLVVATADGLIFRFAKHTTAQSSQRREQKILPLLRRQHLGLRIPEIEFALDSSAAFPFGVTGYRKLPGRPLTPGDVDHENHGRIANQVAQFLDVLHGVDIGSLVDVNLPRFPPSPDRLADLWQTVSPYLAQHVSQREHHAMQRWHETLLDYDHHHLYTPALVHVDLWFENMLYDDAQRRLTGIIDFENASIGDPAIDLATQEYIGKHLARSVIDSYYPPQTAPTDLVSRVTLLMGLRELQGLEHGMMMGNVDAGSVEKVKAAITAER